MPTLRKPTQSMGEDELNQVNLHIRQQPWYQDWFRQQGLNPNQVKLNDRQRAQLTVLAAQNGMSLGDRMKFDGAGNINQKGGFAGMPTWAKVAISAAPVAGAMLIPGAREAVLSNVGGIFGGGGGVGSSGMGPGLAAAASAPTAASTGMGLSIGSAAPMIGAGSKVAAGAGGMNTKSWISKLFGKGGIDPTTLALGGLSFLGGDGGERKSFDGTSVDPVNTLRSALDAIERLSSGIQNRGPVRMRSSYVPKGPEPVSIPGLPFQIGGGLGRDPALEDPSLLEMAGLEMPDLFGSGGGSQSSPRVARRKV